MDLFNQPCADVLVIGVGAMGCAVAGRGALNDASEFPRQAEWAAIHTQSSELFATGLDRRLHLVLPAGMVSDAAVSLVLDARAEEWKRWCQGKRFILIAVSKDDDLATCVVQALARLLRDCGSSLLIVQAGTDAQTVHSYDAVTLRATLPTPPESISPRSVESLQRAQTLEIVEACLGALRASSAASPWLSESFAEFLRWGQLDAHIGSAASIEEIQSAIRQLPRNNGESTFLIIHGAEERRTSELTALRATLDSCTTSAHEASVLSVEGRSAGDGLFWMKLSRLKQSGKVVRLDTIRQGITSPAFAKT